MLWLPDFSLPLFKAHTVASDCAVGGVLVQVGHLIGFEIGKLKESEQRYSAHEKEMTAMKKLSPKQAPRKEFLAEFDFQWEHKLGRHNQIAYTLLRKQTEQMVAVLFTIESDFLLWLRQEIKGYQPLTPHEIAKANVKCSTALKYTQTRQNLMEEARDSLAKAAKRI
ncbi:Reverse transcriptase/retrotransposon-derived protein, RNase H-like domain [Dillenia turbinata]|uniref:Reverse transcriptase/retrotransposon-derived protein, RNase H-like domain n=1 Tax=Dillenia turbinata TaxID=194707 RepID=A0AAN8UW05_9MAGN